MRPFGFAPTSLPALLATTAASCLMLSCSRETATAPDVVEHARTERIAFDAREAATGEDPRFIRLDDLLEEAVFSADPPPAAGPDRVWEFDGSAAGWTLTGGGEPVVSGDRLAWTVGAGSEGILSPALDIPFRELTAIEVRVTASAGKRLRLWWAGSGGFDPKFSLATELRPGEEPRVYTIRTATLRGFEGLRLTRLRLDPSDGETADVAVDSVRLIGREGYYAGRGHGLSQEMIANQHRNVVFHRAPSEIAWDLTLPAGAGLDAGVGLLEAREGVTVSVRIEEKGRATELLREEFGDDTAWHDLTADLSRWQGRRVRLVLAADSATPGQIVLWSNPMIYAGDDATGRPPNVILYLVDTLRSDHVGAYGAANPTSPAMDRLAAEGALFERCSAEACWTRPSVASIVTSLPPPAHGVTDHGLAASDAVVTLAEQLRQRGYLTAAFSTSTHPGSSSNLQQGYDFYYEPPAITGSASLIEEGRKKDFTKKNAAYLNDTLMPWLRRHGERPFFLYLHTMDPHAPYEPPAPYDTMFATGYDGPVGGAFEGPSAFSLARTPEEIAHVLSLYDGDIRDNDDRIGELLDTLAAQGVLDDTLIVVTSDHGEEFREHGGFEHGQSLHRELLDVPLIMRLPGTIRAGARVKARVSGLDVMPTILDVAGIEPNPDVQGRSLFGLVRSGPPGVSGSSLNEEAAAARDIFSWRLGKHGVEEVSLERGDLKAIVRGEGIEFYDRSTDPLELRDIAAERPAVARELAAEARAWLASQRRITTPGEFSNISVDAEERKWLEALGYVK